MDCVSMEALEASRSIYKTFTSPSIFRWIESCMTPQPGSADRLPIALEDARDWIDSVQLSTAATEDSNPAFTSSWCMTMEQVLKEYSHGIKYQPAEMYYLDLAMTFALHGLSDLYQRHGGLM